MVTAVLTSDGGDGGAGSAPLRPWVSEESMAFRTIYLLLHAKFQKHTQTQTKQSDASWHWQRYGVEVSWIYSW